MLQVVKMMEHPDIVISWEDDDSDNRNGLDQLRLEIEYFIEEKINQSIKNVVAGYLSDAANEDIDNYLKNKNLYKRWEVKLPDDIKRAGESGLWGLENK